MYKSMRKFSSFFVIALLSSVLAFQPVSAQVTPRDTYCIYSCNYTANWATLAANGSTIFFNQRNQGFAVSSGASSSFVYKISKDGKTVTPVLSETSTQNALRHSAFKNTTMRDNHLVLFGFLSTNSSQVIRYRYNTVSTQESSITTNLSGLIDLNGYTVANSPRALTVDTKSNTYVLFQKGITKEYKVVKFNEGFKPVYNRDLTLSNPQAFDVDGEGNIHFVNQNGAVKVLTVNDNYSVESAKTYKINVDVNTTAVSLLVSDTNSPSDIYVVYENAGVQSLKQIQPSNGKIKNVNLDADKYSLFATSWDKRIVIATLKTTDPLKKLSFYRTASDHSELKLFTQSNFSTMPTVIRRNFSGDAFIMIGTNISKVDFNPAISLNGIIGSLNNLVI